jgi:hypothetical protein
LLLSVWKMAVLGRLPLLFLPALEKDLLGTSGLRSAEANCSHLQSDICGKATPSFSLPVGETDAVAPSEGRDVGIGRGWSARLLLVAAFLGNFEGFTRIRILHFGSRRESPNVDEKFRVVWTINKARFVGHRTRVGHW